MNTYRNIEQQIDNVVELSSVCRGEWCRSLEVKMDELDNELHDVVSKTCKSDHHLRPFKLMDRMRKGYRNLSHDIHV